MDHDRAWRNRTRTIFGSEMPIQTKLRQLEMLTRIVKMARHNEKGFLEFVKSGRIRREIIIKNRVDTGT